MTVRKRGINFDDWDESRVRVRPSKRGSRPRTKERPQHEDAALGRVISVDRGRYRIHLMAEEATKDSQHVVTAMRARELRRTALVVGDVVSLVGDLSGRDGTLARVVRLEPRRTVLRRSADDSDVYERVVVANVDTLVIMVAAANPEPRTGFIDRAMVAAYDAKITPILLVTKTDLRDPHDLLAHYRHLDDLEIFTSQSASTQVSTATASTDDSSSHLDPQLLDTLHQRLRGHISALVGPSGVGKSTLINALTLANRATGHVNTVTGRGRHTSSSAHAFKLPDEPVPSEVPAQHHPDSWIIDTPGIRSFGLGLVDPNQVVQAFDDLLPAVAHCPKGCTHLTSSPGCALDSWVEEGHAGDFGPARLQSLRRLLESRTAQDDAPRGVETDEPSP